MSIRHMLFGIITIFACITAIFSGISVKNAYEEKQRFEFAQEASETIRYLLTAGGHWAVERGVTNSSLQNNNIVSDAFANKFKQRRRLGNEAYEKAIQSFEKHNLQHLSRLLADAKKAHSEAQKYRTLVDQNYNLVKAQRNQALLKNWVSVMGKQIIASQDLRFALTKEISAANPELGRQAQLKHFSWLMSEYAGRERAVIGGILASEAKISPQKLQTLSEFRGRVLAGWETVQKLVTNSNDTVQRTLLDTNNIFFGSYQTLREKIYMGGIAGQAYETSAPLWIEKATGAINTLLATQKASNNETDLYIQNQLSEVNSNLYLSIAVFCITFIITIGACYVVIMMISRPLYDIYTSLNLLSKDTEAFEAIEIKHIDKSNEIGSLARGIQRFQSSLIEQEESRRREADYIEKQAQSEKDRRDAEDETARVTKLQHEKEVQRAQEMDRLIENFSVNIGQFMSAVQNSVGGLQDSSSSLAALSEETGAGAETLSQQTKSMTHIIKEISSSTDNMMSSFSQVEGAVKNTETMIHQVTEFTEKADEMTDNFTNASRKVTKAVNLISTIANQINLLALNAGIESARAGEAGKGFAVVASEVKLLANETGDSVQEIDHVIQSMCAVSGDMANTLRQIGSSMESVRSAAAQIEDAVGEQRASSGQIFESIKHSSEVSTSVANASVELSQGANESSNVSCSVNEVSDQISHKSKDLQKFINNFLSDIKNIQDQKAG